MGAARGKELQSLSLNRSGNNPNPNPQVPTKDFVASKIAAASKAAKDAARGTLKDKSATTSIKTREHFSPRQEN
jgi:hypothetical protein